LKENLVYTKTYEPSFLFSYIMNLKTTPFPFRVDKFPFFYGWIILIAGTLGVLMSIPGQTMGISVFTDHLLEALKIERTTISLAYMLGTITSGLLITRAGRFYDKYGARVMAMFGGIMLGFTLLYLSKIDFITGALSSIFSSFSYTSVAMIFLIIGFFGVRFFGQGILTMVSRNMVMKWFETRRGLANAIMGIFVSFGFSYAPRLFNLMIDHGGWRHAWQVMGLVGAVGFVLFALLFFRDNARDCGLKPDGKWVKKTKVNTTSNQLKEFTLKEAVKQYSFWIFNLTIALHALFMTALTFHIISLASESGLDSQRAIAIFLPASFIAVSINFIGGWLSDYIKLKYLLMVHLTGVLIASFALIQLEHSPSAYSFLILGFGMCSGIFSIINTVTWPRFFGTKHLGSISGFSMSWTVIASAIGPYIFSLSLKYSGSYTTGILICAGIASVLLLLSFKANNVQR